MATITGVQSAINNSAQQVLWETITTTNNVGSGIELSSHADRSFHAVGNFGTGGTIDIEGSNDGTNWALLKDPFGTDLQLTSAAPLASLTEATRYVRPSLSAGTGGVDLDVYMYARQTRTPT